jgi:hypothetical protein
VAQSGKARRREPPDLQNEQIDPSDQECAEYWRYSMLALSFPAREYVDAQRAKQYAKRIEFTSRRIADKFRDQILEALDAHLESLS